MSKSKNPIEIKFNHIINKIKILDKKNQLIKLKSLFLIKENIILELFCLK